MKIALVHDYLKEFGGAERVLMALHEMWPEAPIYTIVSSKLNPFDRLRVDAEQGRSIKTQSSKLLGEKFRNCEIRTSWLQKLPLATKLISPLRILSPLGFKSFDFSRFDAVIVSATGAYFPNLIKTKPGTLHICYCHTPPRYLYGYPTARDWKKHWWARILGETANHFLRQVDYLSYQRPDYLIANSKNTAARIEKFYRREAAVIYPPVDLPEAAADSSTSAEADNDGYFLAGGRLARAKRIDLAVEACARLGLPLKVFGKDFGGYGEELIKKSKIKNQKSKIEFLGEVSDEEKDRLMANCKAFIFPAEEEDFGITPVEAMAHGKPVIALRQGGVMETVVDPSTSSGQGATGVFFDEPTVEALIKGIKGLKGLKFRAEDCRRQARKFSKERFKREMRKFMEENLSSQS